MNFGSDNLSGASQQVMDTLLEANNGYAAGYGDDEWSKQAVDEIRRVFEKDDLEAFFVTTGTVANCLSLACLVRPWQSIICNGTAHLATDESTAPEFLTGGARVVPIIHQDGKLSARHIEEHMESIEDDCPHNSEVAAVSITQSNEIGLAYSIEEIQAISKVCKRFNLKLHMDGARFTNALVSQGCTAAELTWKAGVDVLSFGASKCGALCAEAVIFFDKKLSTDFIHHRKRSGQLVSKGRMFGAQFVGWLRDDHWLELARHANEQAALLTTELNQIDDIEIAWSAEANQLFVVMPKALAEQLRAAGAKFYNWDQQALPPHLTLADDQCFVRLVCSFASLDQDREALLDNIRHYTNKMTASS